MAAEVQVKALLERCGTRRPTRAARKPSRNDERGSAIILALLVAVILTLLGMSFLWMAETEMMISENEKLASQALYVAEGATRVVKSWFDEPNTALFVPTPTEVDRSLRMLDLDGVGPTAPVAAGGGNPIYKEGVDLDADLVDDLFLPPYRGGDEHALLGTPDGPDIRIDAANAASTTFLRDMSIAIARDLESPLTRARVQRVDIFGPPYVLDGAVWVRYGLGTIRVTVQIFRGIEGSADERKVAERTVQAVLNETPYLGPFGALHSCGAIDWDDDLSIRWGAVTSILNSDMPPSTSNYRESLPRSLPTNPRFDSFWSSTWDDPAPYNASTFKATVDGQPIQDPWFRVLSGGAIGVPGTALQSEPSFWASGPPAPAPSNYWSRRSHLFQRLPYVGCPVYDYELWKTIAAAGESHVHYYVWDSGDQFLENGRGPAQSLEDITDGRSGIYFFDTEDGLAPRDTNADSIIDNLTPAITISGGTWSFRGFLFLNAESFQVSGSTGRSTVFNAPGEPFEDSSGLPNGQWDSGETWINLVYSTTDPFASFTANAADALQDPGGSGSTAIRNTTGPDIPTTANFEGIMFTNGTFEARGAGRYYGSVIARGGVTQSSAASDRPEIFWDDRIGRRQWPPEAWNMPRVILTQWAPDPGAP